VLERRERFPPPTCITDTSGRWCVITVNAAKRIHAQSTGWSPTLGCNGLHDG